MKTKKPKMRANLTQGQNYLLRSSLQSLLGNSLGDQSKKEIQELNLQILRDALSSKFLFQDMTRQIK